MSAPQFTPGPWNIAHRASSSGKVVIEPDVAVVYVQPNRYDGSQSATRIANARLIAAAPDLYAFASKFVARGGYVSADLAELATEARAILDRVDGVRP